MKHTIRILFFLISSLYLQTSAGQSNNVRGFYVPGTDTWIGNTTTENAILSYASGNGYTYITLYSLGSFDWSNSTKKNQLASFISRARNTYGISQVGASGEIYSFFRDFIIPYNNSRTSSSEKFNVFNFEFEWWNANKISTQYCSRYLTPNGYTCDSTGAWNFSFLQFQRIDSSAAANGITSEYYFGWPTKGRMQQVARIADRILLHAYRTSDIDVYQYSRNRLIDIASINQSVKVIPIFSAEATFMGPWLASNPITKPYQTYSTNYSNETGTFKQYINLQGYQWYNYDHLPKTTTAIATISASGPTTFCTGGTVTLTANSGSAYLWSSGQTTQSITVSTSGTYTVRVTNTSGASAVSAAVSVTVTTSIAAPTVTASGPLSFCPGGSVTLTSSSANSYLWSTGATTQSIVVTTSGTYKVTATSGTCSATSSNVTVSVTSTPPTPTITASGSLSFCPGSTVTLTSSQAVSYQWSNGATTRSIVVASAGTYWVRAFGGPNCYSQSANVVTSLKTAPSKPTISASGSTTLTTSNTSVTLTSSSASTYSWSSGSSTRSITVTSQGSYRVTVSNSGGCTAVSDAISVSANGCTPPPVPTITSSGSNILVSGQTVTLTCSSAGGYLWSNGATTQSITVSAAGTYSVRAYNGGGCFSTSLPLTVYVVLAKNSRPEENKFDLSTYPNPAEQFTLVQFVTPMAGNYIAEIVDLEGRIIQSNQLAAYAGKNEFELDLRNLQRGVYLLRVYGNDTAVTTRLVIQ
jgi:hypothetical protein